MTKSTDCSRLLNVEFSSIYFHFAEQSYILLMFTYPVKGPVYIRTLIGNGSFTIKDYYSSYFLFSNLQNVENVIG